MEFLVCQLNMVVQFIQAPCKHFQVILILPCLSLFTSQLLQLENVSQVCPMADNFTMELLKTTEFYPILSEYRTEILSVLKYDDDQDYFSYIRLFTLEVRRFTEIKMIQFNLLH